MTKLIVRMMIKKMSTWNSMMTMMAKMMVQVKLMENHQTEWKKSYQAEMRLR